jgi:hypothetical protein
MNQEIKFKMLSGGIWMPDILDMNLDDAMIRVIFGPAVNAECREMLKADGAEHVALISRLFSVLAAVCEEPGLEHWLEPRGRKVLLHFDGELSTTGDDAST